MSKPNTSEEVTTFEDVYDSEMSDDDYGFILGPNGELKSVFVPDNASFNTPKNVLKILKMFGIYDVDNLTGEETLH